MTKLNDDAFVAEQITDAVAPFVGRLPNTELEWMREQLRQLLVDDPELSAALNGAHPRHVDVSGERVHPLADTVLQDESPAQDESGLAFDETKFGS